MAEKMFIGVHGVDEEIFNRFRQYCKDIRRQQGAVLEEVLDRFLMEMDK